MRRPYASVIKSAPILQRTSISALATTTIGLKKAETSSPLRPPSPSAAKSNNIVSCQKQRECDTAVIAVIYRVSTIGTGTETSNHDVSDLPVIPILNKVYCLRFLDHSLKEDCAIIAITLKGVSETPSSSVRVFDTYGIPTTNLLLTLRNCKVVVEGRPSTTPSKLCVRLSPHIAFPLSVAIDALGQRPLLLDFLSISL